jgi:hypothetical protein
VSNELERYSELKNKADALQKQISRAEGALEQSLTRIQQEYGCKSLVQAKRKLERLEQEHVGAVDAFNIAAEEFEEKWKEVLEI